MAWKTLLPWAAALHAVALPAAVGIAAARARATVPPRAGTVALAAALGLVLAALSLPFSFASTPGAWLSSRSIVDAILNPTLLPLLLARAGAAAAFYGTWLIADPMPGADRRIQPADRLAVALSIAGAGLFAAAAWLWVRAVGPASVDRLLEEAPLAAAAAALSTFALPAFAALTLLFARSAPFRSEPLRRVGLAALALSAVAGIGGAEGVRVALSGPWIVGVPGQGWLYANGLTEEETTAARRAGLAAVRAEVGPSSEPPSAERGARVFGVACAPCHASRSMRDRLAGWPKEAIDAALVRLERLSSGSPPFPGDRADRADLALHLALLDGTADGTLPAPDPARVAEGRRIFDGTCAHCHREIRLERRVAGWSEPLAYDVVGRLYRMNPGMPRFDFTDEERRALAAYVVTLGGR